MKLQYILLSLIFVGCLFADYKYSKIEHKNLSFIEGRSLVISDNKINIKVFASETKTQNVPLGICLRTEYNLCSIDWYKKRELYSGLIY